MAARASNIFNHILKTKTEKKKVYSPRKKFDCSVITYEGYRASISEDIREVSVLQKHQPLKPSAEMVDACYMNIAPSSNALYVGRAPLKVGKMPTKVVKPNVRAYGVNERLPEVYQRDLWNRYIISGGFTGSQKQLIRFSEGKRFIPKSYSQRIENITAFFERFKLTNALRKPRVGEIHLMPFRGSSAPGGDCTGSYSNKRESWASACTAAQILWERIHKEPLPNLSIYTCGGREKVASGEAFGDTMQSRLVAMQDQVEFQLAKPYVRLVEQFFFNNWDTPIVIGRPLTHNRFPLLLNKLTWYKYGFEFDWGGYDASVNAEFIIAAFAVVRGMFPEGKDIDNAFVYFCHGYLEKNLVAADGNLFKIYRGTPSGNAWTTIINSIVNALLWEEIGRKYPPFAGKPFDYIVAGDDGVMFWNSKTNFKSENLTKWIKRKFDMDLEVTGRGAPISSDPNKSLSFNKKCLYWSGGRAVATTQPKLLAKRLLPMSRVNQSEYRLLETLDGQLSELLNHPDCDVILNASYAGYSSHSKFPGLPSLVSRMVQSTLYVGSGKEDLYNRDEYSVDKIHPMADDQLLLEKPDYDFVENWLADNTQPFRNVQLLKDSRLKWLIQKTGLPTSVCALWRLMKLESINPVKFGVPQKEIDEIYRVWCKWFSSDPATTIFAV